MTEALTDCQNAAENYDPQGLLYSNLPVKPIIINTKGGKKIINILIVTHHFISNDKDFTIYLFLSH